MSVLGAIGIWILDAAIDSGLQQALLESLITEISPMSSIPSFILLSFSCSHRDQQHPCRRKHAERSYGRVLPIWRMSGRGPKRHRAIPTDQHPGPQLPHHLSEPGAQVLVGDQLGKTVTRSIRTGPPVSRLSGGRSFATADAYPGKDRSTERGTSTLRSTRPSPERESEIVAGIEAVRTSASTSGSRESEALLTAIEEAWTASRSST